MTQSGGSTRNLRSDIVFAFMLALGMLSGVAGARCADAAVCERAVCGGAEPVVRFTSRLRIGRWQPFKGSRYFLSAAGCGRGAYCVRLPGPAAGDPGPAGVWAGDADTLARSSAKLKEHSFCRPAGYGGSSLAVSGFRQPGGHLSAVFDQGLGREAIQHRDGLYSYRLFHS